MPRDNGWVLNVFEQPLLCWEKADTATRQAVLDAFCVPENMRHLHWVLRESPEGDPELVATSEATLAPGCCSGWAGSIL